MIFPSLIDIQHVFFIARIFSTCLLLGVKMAIPCRAVAAVAATALSTGIGGFIIGRFYQDRESFVVNAQLKDVLQPAEDELASPPGTPARSDVKSMFSFKELETSLIVGSSADKSVGPHRASEIMQV